MCALIGGRGAYNTKAGSQGSTVPALFTKMSTLPNSLLIFLAAACVQGRHTQKLPGQSR